MHKFEVDIEQRNFGVVVIEANSPEEAMEKVMSEQSIPDEIYTGTNPKAVDARLAYE